MPSRELAERYPNLLAIGGHPSVDMPPQVVEAAALAAQRPVYAPTRGLLPLREAIAERIGAELGRAIDPESEVLITLGGMQGLYLAAQAFGTRAVTPRPSFFFPQVVAAAGGSCVGTGGVDGRPDWAAFGAAIGPETTLAIVNTPVNPTGYVLRPTTSTRSPPRSPARTPCCSPTKRTPASSTTALRMSRRRRIPASPGGPWC